MLLVGPVGPDEVGPGVDRFLSESHDLSSSCSELLTARPAILVPLLLSASLVIAATRRGSP